jgi:hypothetical protein
VSKASWKCDGNVAVFGVCMVLLPKEPVVGVAVGLGKVQSATLDIQVSLLYVPHVWNSLFLPGKRLIKLHVSGLQ